MAKHPHLSTTQKRHRQNRATSQAHRAARGLSLQAVERLATIAANKAAKQTAKADHEARAAVEQAAAQAAYYAEFPDATPEEAATSVTRAEGRNRRRRRAAAATEFLARTAQMETQHAHL